MRRGKLFSVVFLVLMVFGAGLAWVIYQQLEASAPPASVPKSAELAPEIPELPPLPEFSMEPMINFSAVIDRPVFSQSRQPSAVKVTGTTAPVANTIELVLKGVIYTDVERTALFQPKDTKDVVRLSEGGSYQGWDLVKVAPSEVLFRRGEREESLALVFDTAPTVVQKPPRERRRARERARGDEEEDFAEDDDDE